MSDDINLTFKASIPDDDDLKTLDRIATETGDIATADIRELARILFAVAREANATVGLLQRLASIGGLRIS